MFKLCFKEFFIRKLRKWLVMTNFLRCLSSFNIQLFGGNYDIYHTVSRKILPAIRARYIRIHPKGWRSYIAMRVELYGGRLKGNKTLNRELHWTAVLRYKLKQSETCNTHPRHHTKGRRIHRTIIVLLFRWFLYRFILSTQGNSRELNTGSPH